ncbi:MAG TPA: VanZ family protein [Bacteroidales bacterium]|nr:VanZ family protein [Bacteroidales bacterium]
MLRLISNFKPYSKYFFVAWLLIIMTVSSIPKLPTLKIETERGIIRLDYLIHFCEYASLAFFAFLTYAENFFRLGKKKYLIVTTGLILFALIDEFHQKYIPGRTFNMKDIYSNITGIAAALIFCIVVFRYLEKRKV